MGRACLLTRREACNASGDDDVIKRTFSPHKGSVTWALLFRGCGSIWAVKQTIEWPVIWDYMTFIWRRHDVCYLHYIQLHWILLDFSCHMSLFRLVKFIEYKHKVNQWITNGVLKSLKYKDRLYKQLRSTDKYNAHNFVVFGIYFITVLCEFIYIVPKHYRGKWPCINRISQLYLSRYCDDYGDFYYIKLNIRKTENIYRHITFSVPVIYVLECSIDQNVT